MWLGSSYFPRLSHLREVVVRLASVNQGVRPSNSRSAKHDIFRSSEGIVGNSRNEGNLGSLRFSVKREIDQRVWPHFSLCTREMGGPRVSNNATCRRTH